VTSFAKWHAIRRAVVAVMVVNVMDLHAISFAADKATHFAFPIATHEGSNRTPPLIPWVVRNSQEVRRRALLSPESPVA
jgi:hypothetical protein